MESSLYPPMLTTDKRQIKIGKTYFWRQYHGVIKVKCVGLDLRLRQLTVQRNDGAEETINIRRRAYEIYTTQSAVARVERKELVNKVRTAASRQRRALREHIRAKKELIRFDVAARR